MKNTVLTPRGRVNYVAAQLGLSKMVVAEALDLDIALVGAAPSFGDNGVYSELYRNLVSYYSCPKNEKDDRLAIWEDSARGYAISFNGTLNQMHDLYKLFPPGGEEARTLFRRMTRMCKSFRELELVQSWEIRDSRELREIIVKYDDLSKKEG